MILLNQWPLPLSMNEGTKMSIGPLIQRLTAILACLALLFSFSAHVAVAQEFPNVWDEGISGVLLMGKFRTLQTLNATKPEDHWRDTLITELAARTRDTTAFYQALDDKNLAGVGALLVYLRETGSRTDQQIKTLSADDMRNIVIVELTPTHPGVDLQRLTNPELIQLVLGRDHSYIRGVMLVGKFRTPQALDAIEPEDHWRNTLITELAARTRDTTAFTKRLTTRT